MKKINFIIIILLLFTDCAPLYKQYKDLALANSKKTFRYRATSPTIKKILNHYSDNEKILIIAWENNVFDIKKRVFDAIVYDINSKKIEYIYNTRKNQNELIFSFSKPSNVFDEELFILKKYLEGNEQYLLSLHDSFSNSELTSSFDVFDFKNNKKIKISSIYIDENGKLIQ